MSNEVKITVSGEDAQLLTVWQRQQAEILRNQRALLKMGESGEKAGESAGTAALKALSRFAQMATGVGTVTQAVKVLVEEILRVHEAADGAALRLEKMQRQFSVQSGLKGLELEQAQERITARAKKNAIPLDAANRAAVQLVSSGFSAQEGSGDSLDIFLQAVQASNLGDKDTTELAKASGQFLAARGLAKNGPNLKKALVAVQRLFKGTDMQLSDLSNLAGKSEAFAGVTSMEETLAVFDVLRERSSPDVASTAEKIIFSRLQGASEDPMRKGLLKRMGLKAGDVDLVGENIGTVLDRMAAGMESLPEEQRSAVMQRFFGDEAAAPAMGLIRDRGKIPGLIAMMGDEAGFLEDVAAGTSGKGAARVRAEIGKEQRVAKLDTGFTDVLNAAEELAEERGGNPYLSGIRRKTAQFTAAAGSLFFDRKTAEDFAIEGAFGSAGQRTGEFAVGMDSAGFRKEAEQRAKEAQQAQLEVLNRIAKAVEKPPVVIDPVAPAPKVPPAAAVGRADR